MNITELVQMASHTLDRWAEPVDVREHNQGLWRKIDAYFERKKRIKDKPKTNQTAAKG